jgi:hypothetical protein
VIILFNVYAKVGFKVILIKAECTIEEAKSLAKKYANIVVYSKLGERMMIDETVK